VSRVGGLPETVEDGVTGTVCPAPGEPGAVQAWTAALTQVLAEPGLAREQARRGRERVLRTFDPEHNVGTLVEAWTELARAI
ncbi:MAG TPA: glycosyltransferase, partial [Ramlibacter sp.]|nr:glycosyltransferase [Ramlibacter sp.]